ncbi:PAS domain S-box protein [bacterium]|nr:PAS domain S-box protein [bacterium]
MAVLKGSSNQNNSVPVQNLSDLGSDIKRVEAKLDQLVSSIRNPAPAPEIPEHSPPNLDFAYKAIAELSTDILIEINLDGTIEFISKSATQLGYLPSDLIRSTFPNLIHLEDRAEFVDVLQTIETTEKAVTTIRVKRADQTYVYWECRLGYVPQMQLGNAKPLVIISARDVSQRLKFIRELQESVEEKEVLLKEIHHRVKNNLQIISSMLSIQSHYFKDAQVQEVFRECQNRIKTMALIHETLYQTKNLAKIEFSTYLSTLIQRIASSNREISVRVRFTVNVPEITLHIDTAIACGLIVNELVTNSCKYAFPENREGEITIEMTTRDDGRYALTTKDNGVGFQKEIDLSKSNSMGLQLVTTLAHQLDADLELDKLNGTSFTLVFSDLSSDGEE